MYETGIKLQNFVGLSDLMTARELISQEIPALKPSDTAAKAIKLMEELHVAHLPMVYNEEYIGLIPEDIVLGTHDPELVLGKLGLTVTRPFSFGHQHIYEVIRLIANHRLTVAPVLDDRQHYLGCISMTGLVQHFAEMGAIQNPGGILVVELNMNDYSLAEIAHVIESNDTRILSSYITSQADSTKIELTLKLNKTDLSRVQSALFRHNYNVKASFNEDTYRDDLKTRFDSLMKYLNI